MDLAKSLFRGDKGIWTIFFFLCVISLVEVFSSSIALSSTQGGIHWTPIMKHFVLLVFGMFIVLIVHNIPYKWFNLLVLMVPVAFVLLIFAMIWGVEKGGASRWIFGFQPSELAKISVIVSVAFLLGRMKDTPASKQMTFNALIWGVGVICFFIMLDNLSTALLLLTVCLIMMIIGNIPIMKLVKIIVPVIAFALLMYMVAPVFDKFGDEEIAETEHVQEKSGIVSAFSRIPTWRNRVDRFIDNILHDKSPQVYMEEDKNYQPGYARIAIARGGFSPKLPGNSYARNFLPEANSDFIYAIIIEELGIIGGIFVIILYVALLIRCGRLVQKCKKKFPAFLLIGCSLIIFCQAMIHMLVCAQLMPVTGQPLPLISKGGTSIWITCMYFGIILSISRTIIPSEIERNSTFAEMSDDGSEPGDDIMANEEEIPAPPVLSADKQKQPSRKRQREYFDD